LFTAVECPQSFPQGGEAGRYVTPRFDGSQLPDQAAVPLKGKSHFWVSQRCECEIVLDMGGFRFLCAQKLTPRGQIEEELPHLHGCSMRAARRLDLQYLAAADDHLRPLGGITGALTRSEGEAAHARDAGQGLAAEAHGGDGSKVFGPADPAGGMPLQAE